MPAKKRGARACRHAQGHTGTAAFKKRKQRNLFDRQNFHFLFCHQSNWPKTSFTRDKKSVTNYWQTLVNFSLFAIRFSYQPTWRIGERRLGHFWQWQLKQQVVTKTGFEYLFTRSYQINNLNRINVYYGHFLKMKDQIYFWVIFCFFYVSFQVKIL